MSPTENVTGKRVVAALVDIVTLSVVFVVFVLLFGDTESSTTTSSGTTTDHGFRFNLNGWPFVVYLIVALAYFIVTEAVWPATPGKLALGLRVTSVGGAPMTIGKAVVRNLLRIVDGLPVLYLVGIITIAASKLDQRVGDMVAGTVVVSARTSGAPSEPRSADPTPTLAADS